MSDQPIHEAARRADRDALRRELENGVSANAFGYCPGSIDGTPLHYLCLGNDNAEARVECVHMLIEAGADINASNVVQQTPLYYAARYSNADVVAALIKAGADVNRGDADGETPLHVACRRSDYDVEPASLLLRNGAESDLNARCRWGSTPLDYAIRLSRRRLSRRRLVPILLRSAGAALPAETNDAYIRKVIAAGGFRQYERIHLNALTATFAPKFAHRSLPPEMVRRVVEYAFHVGDY